MANRNVKVLNQLRHCTGDGYLFVSGIYMLRKSKRPEILSLWDRR